MTIIDLLEEIYSSLTANKARSGLTILGIVIGIASVIAMIAIGQGAQSSIQSSIQSIGSNLILVVPGTQRSPGVRVSSGRGSAQSLTLDDSNAISQNIPLVKNIAPELTVNYQIIAKGNNINTQVTGTTASFLEVRNFQVSEGSFITDQQVRSIDKVAVLGSSARDDLFGKNAEAMSQFIRINNIDFKVIGITKSKGGSSFANPDEAVYIPLTTAQIYLYGNNYLTTISIEANDPSYMSLVQQQVTDLLMKRHNIKDSKLIDFTVVTQADIVATASSVTSIFTALLASIASISLLVGGIGIMNMMLTTVTERTREIGLRKAIGAQQSDISSQFLMEAVILTFLGGFIGILLGWLLATIVAKLINIPSVISLTSILLAFGVSAGIGIAFGYYPARRAAKLNPIDALRFE